MRPESAGGSAAEFWTLCVRLAIRNLFVTGPLFLVEIGGAAVLAWIDPPLLLLGLPLLALQLMRVTANFGLRRQLASGQVAGRLRPTSGETLLRPTGNSG